MKLAPNQPCRCGSGKKYKKCCMLSDEESARGARVVADSTKPAREPEGSSAPSREVSRTAEIEAWEESLAAFREADLAGKLGLIHTTIKDGSMDGEMAFELLGMVFSAAVERGELGRFDEAVFMLQQHAPEAYKQEKAYIDEWLLESAFLCGKLDTIPPLAMSLVEGVPVDPDRLVRVMHLLACYGELQLLIRMAEAAWPQIRASDDVMEWAMDEFANYGVSLLLLGLEEQDGRAAEIDADRQHRIAQFGEFDLTRLQAALDHLAGRADRAWTMKDFDFSAPSQPRDRHERSSDGKGGVRADEERRERNLWLIGYEFIGWARRQEGIPTTLALLGVNQIRAYIRERAEARLGPRVSMIDRALNPGRVRALRAFPKPEHVLCPDDRSADTYLGQLAGLFSLQHASACAFVAVMPAWLRFLESSGLVDAAVGERSLRAMRGLASSVARLLKGQAPALGRVLDRWGMQQA